MSVIIRIRFKKLGGHYHCRLFTAPGINLTFAKCGDIVFDEREWSEVRRQLELGHVEFLEDSA